MTFTWVIDFISATGAVLTTLCWLPQALQIVRERETRALSLPATGLFTAGIALSGDLDTDDATAVAEAWLILAEMNATQAKMDALSKRRRQ
jgi:hypothetical protein